MHRCEPGDHHLIHEGLLRKSEMQRKLEMMEERHD